MHHITEQYKEQIRSYEDFKIKIEILVKELLIQNRIDFHKIESRIKDPAKLDDKIQRKNDKYNDILEITDVVGLRIITYFEDEVDNVAKIIEQEFIMDPENSIDKRTLESDRFGYKSLHYVVSLNEQRKQLTEYVRFNNIKFEIQVRSILQHAWAEIEHDIGYKGEHAIPDSLKRNFYRVAALLETADIEFVNIRKSLTKYEENIKENIKRHPEDVELNAASLKAFITTNPTVKKIENEINAKTSLKVSNINTSVTDLVTRLYFVDINTILELEQALQKNADKIVKFVREWTKSRGTVSAGISVFYLCYVLIGERNNIDLATSYFTKFFKRTARDNDGLRILDVYKKIST